MILRELIKILISYDLDSEVMYEADTTGYAVHIKGAFIIPDTKVITIVGDHDS